MNRADELGMVEGGKDLGVINNGELPESGPLVDVEVQAGSAGTMIIPIRGEQTVRRSLELREKPDSLLMAQMVEDPSTTAFQVPGVGTVQTSGSRLQRAITRNQNREELVWFGIDSHNLSAALGDRIIVRRDTLESEYVCRECKGKGHTDEPCKRCEGTQRVGGVECSECRVIGFEQENPHPCGFVRCGACFGSGWRNGIVIPEVAKGKPVTGVVVSLGPDTKLLKLGDRVLHSQYSGHTLEMKAETYTYMRESEVISLLRDM